MIMIMIIIICVVDALIQGNMHCLLFYMRFLYTDEAMQDKCLFLGYNESGSTWKQNPQPVLNKASPLTTVPNCCLDKQQCVWDRAPTAVHS